MVANLDKFHPIFMGLEKGQRVNLEINGQPIKATEEVKLLRIAIDSKLEFIIMLKVSAKRQVEKSGPSRASLGSGMICWGRALGGLGLQPLRKFFVSTPFSLPENEGNVLLRLIFLKYCLDIPCRGYIQKLY